MKILLSLVAIGVFISILGGTSAYGQSALPCPSCVQIPYHEIELYKELFPLIIWTDSQIFNHESKITVHGFLRPENAVAPVTITVTNPIGNIVGIEQLTASPDGNFSFVLNTASTTMKKDGEYIIKATAGSDTRVFKTKVTLVSHDLGDVNACTINEISVVANNGGIYCIPYKVNKGLTGIEGTLDVAAKTLSINVRATDIDSVTLHIPRHILDSKTDGNDSEFVVMSFGRMIPYEELESDDYTRTIKIDYTPIRNGQFDIIGTHVVPEFGPLVFIILVTSITAILVLTKTQKLIRI